MAARPTPRPPLPRRDATSTAPAAFATARRPALLLVLRVLLSTVPAARPGRRSLVGTIPPRYLSGVLRRYPYPPVDMGVAPPLSSWQRPRHSCRHPAGCGACSERGAVANGGSCRRPSSVSSPPRPVSAWPSWHCGASLVESLRRRYWLWRPSSRCHRWCRPAHRRCRARVVVDRACGVAAAPGRSRRSPRSLRPRRQPPRHCWSTTPVAAAASLTSCRLDPSLPTPRRRPAPLASHRPTALRLWRPSRLRHCLPVVKPPSLSLLL